MTSLQGTSELAEIAAAAAESFLETFAADTGSVSLIQGDEYRTLVNVGVLFPGETRFPEDEIYEIGYYPKASEALMRGEGYVSSIDTKGQVESDRMLKEFDRGTCMGSRSRTYARPSAKSSLPGRMGTRPSPPMTSG